MGMLNFPQNTLLLLHHLHSTASETGSKQRYRYGVQYTYRIGAFKFVFEHEYAQQNGENCKYLLPIMSWRLEQKGCERDNRMEEKQQKKFVQQSQSEKENAKKTNFN